MFETRTFSYKKVSKEVIREYKDGKLVRERTIVNDGGTSQEEAEDRLSKVEERLDKTSKHMENIFSEMDKMFKDMF